MKKEVIFLLGGTFLLLGIIIVKQMIETDSEPMSRYTPVKENESESFETMGPPVEIDDIEEYSEEEIEIKKRNTSDLMKNVSLKNREEYLSFFNYATEYAQVSDGHYYYMRMSGKNKYTIYRDKGEKVGSFKTGKSKVNGCVRYKSQFFLQLRERLQKKKMTKLAVVDFSTSSVKILCEYNDEFKSRFSFCGNKIYYLKMDIISSMGEDKVEVMNLNGEKISEASYPKDKKNQLIWQKEIINGKLYYVRTNEKERETLGFRRNLKTGKDEVLFRIQIPADIQDVIQDTYFEYKKDGIYWITASSGYEVTYKIITSEGKMKKVKSKKRSKYDSYDMIYQKPFYFYIDKEDRIHRWNKEKKEDKIISSIEAMEIACTEQGLFVQEYDEWLDDMETDLDDDTANALYYMDFNGGNVKKLAKAN